MSFTTRWAHIILPSTINSLTQLSSTLTRKTCFASPDIYITLDETRTGILATHTVTVAIIHISFVRCPTLGLAGFVKQGLQRQPEEDEQAFEYPKRERHKHWLAYKRRLYAEITTRLAACMTTDLYTSTRYKHDLVFSRSISLFGNIEIESCSRIY